MDWTGALLGATLIEFGIRVLWAIGGCIVTALGLWGLRVRISALENKPQSPSLVVQQIVHGGQQSVGLERHISSTTIDQIESMSQDDYDAITVKNERTLYFVN